MNDKHISTGGTAHPTVEEYNKCLDLLARWVEGYGDSKAIVLGLMRFRWKSLGYGKLACRSCGAQASEEHDSAVPIKRTEECSRSCPFRRAEEWLERVEKVNATTPGQVPPAS